MPAPHAALRAEALVKTYRSGRSRRAGQPDRATREQPPVRALDGFSCTAEPGTVLALLGPNGAGKSTAVRVLTTLTRPDSGSAVVAGHDVVRHPERVRRAIGLVAQGSGADAGHTGRENVVLAARLQGMTRVAAAARAATLLDRFGLADAADRRAGTYSGGMLRGLDVAIGLVHRPQVLFLDEPTTGLDPQSRLRMWAEIARIAREDGATVLLTTHDLAEADHLAHHVVIVDHGHVLVEGHPDELKASLRGDTLTVELAPEASTDAAQAALTALDDVRDVTVVDHTVRARSDRAAAALPGVIAALERAGAPAAAASVARPTLDDVYLRHTGRTLTAVQAEAERRSGTPGTEAVA